MPTWALIVLQLVAGRPVECVLRDDIPTFEVCLRLGASAMLKDHAIRSIQCVPLMRG